MQFDEFYLVQMVKSDQRINFSRRRARAVPRARVGAAKNIFIAFLVELGNFKHFEPYLFFSPKIANLAIWRDQIENLGKIFNCPARDRTANHLHARLTLYLHTTVP